MKNETAPHPLPWSIGFNGYEIKDANDYLIILATRECAPDIVTAANALFPLPMQPRLVAEHGLPEPSMLRALVWYRNNDTPTVSLLPPLRPEDVVAWLPIPPLPQKPDPFTLWKKSQPELPDDNVEWCRNAWDAATEAARKEQKP